MNLHKTIVILSGHHRLIDQYSRIQHQILIYIQSSDALVAEPAQIIAQHEPLVAALLSGNEDESVKAAVEHNETEGTILVRHIDN